MIMNIVKTHLSVRITNLFPDSRYSAAAVPQLPTFPHLISALVIPHFTVPFLHFTNTPVLELGYTAVSADVAFSTDANLIWYTGTILCVITICECNVAELNSKGYQLNPH